MMGQRFADRAATAQPGRFTGRHMTVILVAFFGVVIAVNFSMAYVAVSGFGGTVVDNSYVASQNYNRWLAEGRAQAALGWDVAVARDGEGRALVTVRDSEGGWDGQLTGTARHPMGRHAETPLTFTALGEGRYRSTRAVPQGRVVLRLHLRQGDADMRHLVDLP